MSFNMTWQHNFNNKESEKKNHYFFILFYFLGGRDVNKHETLMEVYKNTTFIINYDSEIKGIMLSSPVLQLQYILNYNPWNKMGEESD